MPNQTGQFPCPKCAKPLTVDLPVEVVQRRIKDSTRVELKDLPTIKCPHCGAYVQVEVSSMYVDYEVSELKIA